MFSIRLDMRTHLLPNRILPYILYMRLILFNQNVLQRLFQLSFNSDMEYKLKQTTLLTAALCALSGFVPAMVGGAEGASASVQVLPAYVVVATRTPLSMDRVSPSVDYIGAEEMAFWQDRSLADVLQRQAGMPLVATGTSGSLTSIFTRGTNSNHTSFFLDGRRVNPGFSNQFGIDVLSTANLESVQILRGASSVNYGSNGIGGAIDLRTKSGFDVAERFYSVEAEFGSNNFRRAGFDTAFSEGDLGFSLAGSWMETDNERANDGFERLSATSRVEYRLLENLNFEILGQFSEGDKQVPGNVLNPANDQLNTTQTWLVSPGLQFTTDEFSAHLFYARSENELVNTEPSQRDEIFVESDEISLQLDYTLSEPVLLTTGAVYRNDKASNNNVAFFGPAIPYDEASSQLGGFAQVLWQPAEEVELRGGIRFDDYSDFGSEWTWNIEAIYYIEKLGLSVFSKYATSYVPPRTSDIAFDSDPSTDPVPESSDSFEIGLRQEWFKGDLVLKAVYFRNEIEDLLTFDFTGVGFSGFDIKNVNEATTDGLELSMDFKLLEKINLAGSYTYLTATNEQDDSRLVRRPRHTLQLAADYDFTDYLRAGIRATGYFDREDFQIASPFGQVDSEDFFVIKLVADWKVNANWSVFARVENLLDEEYAPTIGFPALGRTGYIGARFEF